VFPPPERVAAADLSALGMPAARRTALKALAKATIADPDLFRPFGTMDEAIARLRAIRGIGEWTAQYIALRALRETDAFPASDIGLIRSAARGGSTRPTPADLLQRAEPWRPWRAYAAQHLWAADSADRDQRVQEVLRG
jgi:AraC family transcriptional regulator of adaptative response / DNA-3-methyladenine glycosylase II